MAEEIRILGRSRVGVDDHPLELNQNNELLVAQGFPRYTEMSRRGNAYSAIATTAVAGLVIRPDATAAVTLWNGEAAGSKKCYIIDRVFTHCLVATNAEGRFLIWACLHPTGMTKPTTAPIAAGATQKVGPYGKTYNGVSVFDIGATVVDNGWFPLGYSTSHVVGALPGSGISVDVAGRLIIPPTGAISLHVVTSTNTATFCTGISWWEEEITLG